MYVCATDKLLADRLSYTSVVPRIGVLLKDHERNKSGSFRICIEEHFTGFRERFIAAGDSVCADSTSLKQRE